MAVDRLKKYTFTHQSSATQHAPRSRVRKRKTWWLDGAEFRELRLECLLSQRACADFLGVAVRTVRGWDRSHARVPWAVVRLLRVYRNGELLSPQWVGWRLWGDTLWSPEGKAFRPHQLSYWSNTTVAMADLWREERRQLRLSAASKPHAGMTVRDDARAMDGSLAVRSDSAVSTVAGAREGVRIDTQCTPFAADRFFVDADLEREASRQALAPCSPPGLVLTKTTGTLKPLNLRQREVAGGR